MVTITLIPESGTTSLTQTSVTLAIGSNTNVEAIIANTVTTIAEGAFAEANTNNRLLSITIPTTVTTILSQIKATNIYLPSIIFANNVLDPLTLTSDKVANIGNIWATGNYYLSMSNASTSAGPLGKKLNDGKRIPMLMAGMLLCESIIEGNVQQIPTSFVTSFPDAYNVISYGTANNITIHPGFKVICTKNVTNNPNNNQNANITISGNNAVTSFAQYLDNTNGSTNLTGTITSTYPNILLFYNDTLVRTMPGSV